MTDDIERMNLESKDLVAERIEQLKALFPRSITEGSGGGSSPKRSTSRSCA